MKKVSLLAAICWLGMAAVAAEWISVPDAPIFTGKVVDGARAADGTSVFVSEVKFSKPVTSARWTVSGLGVFEVYVNGKRIGEEFLKPGFTHNAKTKYSFSYDITDNLRMGAGVLNELRAEVSAGWWREKIVNFAGKRSAFWGELKVVYTDGSEEILGTDTTHWRAAIGGAVTHAAIFDGEEYDARKVGSGEFKKPEINREFKGEILPSRGGEVFLREDLKRIGRNDGFDLRKGERVVIDFGQNCAAVPYFRFKAKAGTVLTALPAEMLNDANKGERGCDDAKGTIYRANLRRPKSGMKVVYTFAGKGIEEYMPRFTFFGFRYLEISATEDVGIAEVSMVPVSSITKAMETGKITTGDEAVNRLIENVYWGQLSNYLSVPTDCPQRNERLGWSADTQVFAEAGSFNARTYEFLCKWMKDMRDSQHEDGSFPSVAPVAQYGNEGHRLGWADAGVIVPYVMWKQFGDKRIVAENYAAMAKFVAMQTKDKYRDARDEKGRPAFQYADWLSFEDFEPCNGSAYEMVEGKKVIRQAAGEYYDFLGGCYWLWCSKLMSEMAGALGREDDVKMYESIAKSAKEYLVETFIEKRDGKLKKEFRNQQTAMLFALKFGLVEGKAKEWTKNLLRANFAAHDGCLQTGFLGTSILMDTLTENGMGEDAYSILLNHNFPGWLYSVDQGATTIWERWNSWTKKDGFGPVGMNSFNHYAYGSVLAWLYKKAAGIDLKAGERVIVMKPIFDKRLKMVKAEYKSYLGVIKSEWAYEGEEQVVWKFTVPKGAKAEVVVPGSEEVKVYEEGEWEKRLKVGG